MVCVVIHFLPYREFFWPVKTGKNNWDLLSRVFPSQEPKRRDVHAILEENIPFIENPEDIAEIMRHAMRKGTPVFVQLPDSNDAYTTHFESLPEGFDPEGTAPTAFPADWHGVFVAPLEPSRGNLLVRRGGDAVLQFDLEGDTAVCKVSFRGLAHGASKRMIHLSFPWQVSRSWFPDKRRYLRLRVDPDSGLVAKVTRPSGEIFLANLFDISQSGVAFYPRKGKINLLNGLRLQFLFKITEPTSTMLALYGTLVGTQVKEEIVCFQSRFLLGSPTLVKRVERLISFVSQKKTT